MPSRIPVHRPAGWIDPATRRRDYDRSRGRREDIAFYQSPAWRELRRAYLASSPLCERCDGAGLVVLASHVHHRQERKARPDLALDWSNLEALCPPCHSRHHAATRPRGGSVS